MKKIVLSAILILTCLTNVVAQYNTNENKVWIFGNNAGVDFSSGSPVAYPYRPINILEGGASVCNSSGSLLFYTDGMTVYTSLGGLMPGGSSIVPFNTYSTGQAAVIVPCVGHPYQYFVFSLEEFGTTIGNCNLAYSIVDMSLSSGYGAVISAGTPLNSDLDEQMTVVAGDNCDIWLVVHKRGAYQFLAYDITYAGISAPVVSSIGTLTGKGITIKFSPNRLKMVSTTTTGTELYDFNPTTGVVSNCQVINLFTNDLTSEFSPDNTKLYSSYNSTIYQYDITGTSTAAIVASQFTVATTTGLIGQIKLGPDDKIYIAHSWDYLDCISTPNNAGTSTAGCGYVTHAVTLTGWMVNSNYSLPNIYITDPSPLPITGPNIVCAGSTITLSDATTGGTWSTSSGYATVGGTGIVTGVAVGVAVGVALITYTSSIGCITTYPVTVNPYPTISGPTAVCQGSTITLTDAISGGVFFTPSGGHVSVDALTGVVTGLSPGTATVYYILGTGCVATHLITIYPFLYPIYGDAIVCVGYNTTLTELTTGGTWSTSDPLTATVGPSTGIVTGVAAGSVTITYTSPGGCYTTYPITVILMPTITLSGSTVPITAITECMWATTALDATPAGGTWSSANPAVASIGLAGIVTGVLSGVTTITYTLPSGCFATITVTITSPDPIAGNPWVCIGSATTLTDLTPGGTWSSSNPAIASINPTTGVVTGITTGVVTISYSATTSSGCYGISFLTFTVEPLPVMHPNPPVVVCGSVTLTADVTGGSGTYSYAWAPATGLLTTIGMTVTCTGIGLTTGLNIYTIICTDLVTGCQSTALDTVIVMCSPGLCGMCGNTTPTALGGNLGTDGITTVVPAGTYYVYSDLTLHGTVIFNNAVVSVNPGKTIFVDPVSELEVVSSHFFSCGNSLLWNGFVLKSTSGTTSPSSAKCIIYRHSLIEDAQIAVSIIDGVLPSCLACSSPPKLFISQGAIFNRNNIGVSIVRFPGLLMSSLSGLPIPTPYPFLIQNTVFTSRDLSVFPGYPCRWPAENGTPTALAEYWPTSPLLPPFNVDNPNAAGPGLRYLGVPCKNGTLADIGINLQYVGDYAGATGLLTPATFNDITIGDPAGISTPNGSDINLFDTLHEGIKAQYSNVSCYNNAFIHIYPVTGSIASGSGSGILATAPPIALWPPNLAGHKICRLQVLGGTNNVSPNSNWFYDCVNGVWCNEYYYVTGRGAQMFSNINSPYGTAAPTSGTYGYDISSSRYKQISITGNTFTNIFNTGIFMRTTNTGVSSYLEAAGSLAINHNVINSDVGGAMPVLPQFVENGIVVTNVTGIYTHTVTAGVTVNNNTLNFVRNGITVKNYNWQPVNTDSNFVSMAVRPTAPTQQYGITHQNCTADTISKNTVLGPGGFIPYFPLSWLGNPLLDRTLVGVYTSASTSSVVKCNEIDSTNIGFEFYQQVNPSTWIYNTMVRNNYGYVYNGAIGTQGSTTLPSDNLWVGTLWWGLFHPTFGIPYTTVSLQLSNSNLSMLWTRDITWNGATMMYDPANNAANPVYPFQYGGVTGGPLPPIGITWITVYPPTPDCEHGWQKSMARPVFESTATQTVGYPVDFARSNWIGQMALYNNIIYDTTIADSSAIVSQFGSMAAGSRFAWLNNIEQSLANADTAMAAGLLSTGIDADTTTAFDTVTGVIMADDTAADPVVKNYIDFYKIYLRYQGGIMSIADSCKLTVIANMCPYRDGAIVYEARGLYSIVYDDPGTFNDNCTDSTGNGNIDTCKWCEGGRMGHPGTKKTTLSTGQQFKLFPNPNDGTFIMQQQIADNEPVVIEVRDAVGRLIYKEAQAFNDQKMQLQLGAVIPGMYMLQLTDSQGRRYNFKFVVSK